MEQHQAPDYPRRSKRAANLENRALNHNSYMGDFSYVKEQLGLDVWEELKKFPVGIIAKLFDGKSGWSARTVHYLLCRQLKVEKKEIWSVVGDQPIRFSLLEFGEITGLNTDPVPCESIEPDQYRKFWEELNVPHGFGPKPDELRAAARGCRVWSFEKRKWLGLLILQAMGIYAGHHNSRIPFETAKRVFDDEAMMTYPWGRAAFEALVGSIKSLNPVGKTYFINGLSYALLAWAYESVSCFRERFGKLVAEEEVPLLRWDATRTRASFDSVLKTEMKDHGHVRVRHMVSKEFVEEMFPQWPGQDDDPQLNNLIRDLHSGRYVPGDYWDVQKEEKKKKNNLALVPYESEPPKKKQKKDKKHENEAADIEKKEDAKGKVAVREDADALNTIVATLEKIGSKFESHDSMFKKVESMFEKFGSKFDAIESNVGELSRKFDDMDNRIGDYVKDAVDERLKVLGLSESAQNYGPSPKPQTLPRHMSVNSPTVPNTESETPDNVVWPKKPLVDEIDKAESRTPQHYLPKVKAEIPKGTPDVLAKSEEKAVGSKLKGTPEAKKILFGSDQPDFVGISPAKQPDLRRRSRRQNPTENEAELKKKADAAKKRTEAAAKRKENALKKKEEKAAAELKKKEEKAAAELKKKEEKAAAELKKQEEKAAAELKNKPAELKTEFQTKGLRHGIIRLTVPRTPEVKKEKSGGETDIEDVTDKVIANANELLPESDEDEDERLRLARIKEYRARVVQLATNGLAAIPNAPSAIFPYVGDNGTTCMRKDFEPSSAIYDPLSPVDPAKLEKLRQHLMPFEDIPLTDNKNEEVYFYRILISERAQWPNGGYGWLFDTHLASYIRVLIKRSMQDPSPFYSKRIAFVDQWFLGCWIRDFTQFKMNPKMFKFKDSGYESLMNGEIPVDLQTKKKWLEDVDHLYGVLHTGGDHWVAFHVDLLKEKIDAYDPIIGQVTPESEQKMLDAFRPLLQMIPAMMNAVIHGTKTVCGKQFAFRRKSGKHIPQNTQVGDCGVYSLKFIECLALGVSFDGICDANIQGLRVKMAAEILDEGGYDMFAQFS